MHALYSVRFWALQDNNLFLFRFFCEQLLYCRLPLPCGLSSYLVTRMSEFFLSLFFYAVYTTNFSRRHLSWSSVYHFSFVPCGKLSYRLATPPQHALDFHLYAN